MDPAARPNQLFHVPSPSVSVSVLLLARLVVTSVKFEDEDSSSIEASFTVGAGVASATENEDPRSARRSSFVAVSVTAAGLDSFIVLLSSTGFSNFFPLAPPMIMRHTMETATINLILMGVTCK